MNIPARLVLLLAGLSLLLHFVLLLLLLQMPHLGLLLHCCSFGLLLQLPTLLRLPVPKLLPVCMVLLLLPPVRLPFLSLVTQAATHQACRSA